MDATEILNALVEKKNLSGNESREFLNNVFIGGVSPVLTGAILTALRMKGEAVEEVVGLVESMRANMADIHAPGAIDIVGTGGDGAGTFNISTAAAFVARGAGAKIAKHGNRAASSKCGSADVLEALGVKIDLTPSQAEDVFKKTGMVFLFAPVFHPAMKHVVPVRRELKIRTIFNILGPFANPAGTKRQLVGVPNQKVARTMAGAARSLRYDHLLLMTSDDGMDEVSTSAKTYVFDIKGKNVKRFTIDPKKLGFKKAPKSALAGATKEENAEILQSILSGEKGPRRDIVVLNAACALFVAGMAKAIKEGVALAEKSIESGSALRALHDLVRASNAPL